MGSAEFIYLLASRRTLCAESEICEHQSPVNGRKPIPESRVTVGKNLPIAISSCHLDASGLNRDPDATVLPLDRLPGHPNKLAAIDRAWSEFPTD
jgi:hypothetical protein